ncbi:hypothetical protein U9M48_003049 [Paspalum notatum var. saurae]|uniref:CCHC-type domain-containing protein n=1 Tax=Paspalum notatum var. saurae TaxID=547442 RepID=A0AAQ3PS62_PASNO
MEPNPNHGGHTVLRRHYSIVEHETMEMAMEDAAQQALGVLCQHYHTPLCQTQYRYFPRRQSGDTEHEIASIRGEDNRQLLKLVRYVSALITAYVRVSEELHHRNGEVFHLQAQLDRVAGPPPQMVNTRRNAAGGNASQGNQGVGNPLPNPPPLTPEQFYNLQMQMMATMTNAVHVLQQAQAQPPPRPPRDRRGDFLKGHPPTFSHATEPLQADDWLRAVERQLDIAQCNDRERVLYGSGQLRGAALDWWEYYRPQGRDAFTWAQFRENFRNHHVPAGLMKMKKKEFLSPKQGSMSVIEYRDKFLRLAGYATLRGWREDEEKQENFPEGLNDELQYHSMNHTFPSFHQLVDRALFTERKRRRLKKGRGSTTTLHQAATPAPVSLGVRAHGERRAQGQEGYRYRRRYRGQPARPMYPTRCQVQTTPPTTNRTTGVGPCYKCGGVGHYANACPRKVQGNQRGSNRAKGEPSPAAARAPQSTGQGAVAREGESCDESAAEAPNVVLAPDGQKVEVSATKPSGCLHQMEAKPTEGIRVVCEYPDVFPEELPEPTLEQEIRNHQETDEKIQEIREQIKLGKAPHFREDEQGTVWYKNRICVPDVDSIKKLILSEAHDTACSIHPGSTKMYHDLKERFWWYGMKRAVAEYVAVCDTCQCLKAEHQRPAGLLQPLKIPEWKWEEIVMPLASQKP